MMPAELVRPAQSNRRARLRDWSAAALSGAFGGDIAPVRSVLDPYPAFNGVAVDPENNIVLLSDTNRKSLLIYDRTSESRGEITEPQRHIIGPATLLGSFRVWLLIRAGARFTLSQ